MVSQAAVPLRWPAVLVLFQWARLFLSPLVFIADSAPNVLLCSQPAARLAQPLHTPFKVIA
jgi:hypothetical protein